MAIKVAGPVQHVTTTHDLFGNTTHVRNSMGYSIEHVHRLENRSLVITTVISRPNLTPIELEHDGVIEEDGMIIEYYGSSFVCEHIDMLYTVDSLAHIVRWYKPVAI